MEAVLDGEGIGWLKLSRLKKLMEDEQYRMLILQRFNKTLQRKISPDDHIEDVQISKSVWKGMLKIVNAMIYGLEQNYLHHGSSSGMASAFTILEIAHTHYWIKESTGEEKASVVTTASCSQGKQKQIAKLKQLILLHPLYFFQAQRHLVRMRTFQRLANKI